MPLRYETCSDEDRVIRSPSSLQIFPLFVGLKMPLILNRKVPSSSPGNIFDLDRQSDFTEANYNDSLLKLRNILSPNITKQSHKKNSEQTDFPKNRQISQQKEFDVKNDSNMFSSFQLPPGEQSSSPESVILKLHRIAKQHSNLDAGTQELFDFIEKQNEQIKELEKESSSCKREINAVLNKVEEVICENEELNEEKRRYTQSDVKYGNSLERGARSEKVINDSKIAELEAQLLQYKLRLGKSQNDVVNTNNISEIFLQEAGSLCANCKAQSSQLDFLAREKQELQQTISKFEDLLRESRDHESEISRKLNAALQDKEILKDAKSQSELEIYRLKEELDRYQQRVRDLIQESSRKLQDEKLDVERKYRRELDTLNSEMSKDYDALTQAKLDLERQKRMEAEARRELQLKTSLIEDIRSETKIKIDKLQTELAHALSRNNTLEQNCIKARLVADRDDKNELDRLRTELNLAKKSLAESEDNLKKMKSVSDLEQLVTAQNTLMDSMRGECKLLVGQLEETIQQNKLHVVEAVRQGLQSGSPVEMPKEILDELITCVQEMNVWRSSKNAIQKNDQEVLETSAITQPEDSEGNSALNNKGIEESKETEPSERNMIFLDDTIQRWQIQIQSLIDRFLLNSTSKLSPAEILDENEQITTTKPEEVDEEIPWEEE